MLGSNPESCSHAAEPEKLLSASVRFLDHTLQLFLEAVRVLEIGSSLALSIVATRGLLEAATVTA